MDFENFETNLLLDIKNKNKKCLNNINKNRELIQANLGEDSDPRQIDKFVKQLNIAILQLKKFKLVEEILRHPLFKKVYEVFRNSDILIEACKVKKIDTTKWLLTMDINPCVQDDDGMTALMHACKCTGLEFVVRQLMENEKCLHTIDKNGDNALFHALNNNAAILELIKTDIDVNYICSSGEPLFMYCCKNDIFTPISALTTSKNLDINIVDKAGRTPAMYLAEKGRDTEFIYLAKRNCDFNYRNYNNECVLSILIKNLYHDFNNLFAQYIRILSILTHNNCNFNLPVDDTGNSALMVFLIVRDYYTAYYVARYSRSIDLSIKNDYGESPSSLCLKLKDNTNVIETFSKHPTFDFDYVDPNTRNTMLMLCSMTDQPFISDIIENNVNITNEVNNRNENALILATKFGKERAVKTLLQHSIFVNQQDYLGNTALYYAVDIQNTKLIKLLLCNNADMNIKNLDGKSALDLAYEDGNKNVLNALMNPNVYTKTDIDQNHDVEFNPEIKYRETYEYLYPSINNYYNQFKITYPMECLEKSIYTGEIKKLKYPLVGVPATSFDNMIDSMF